MNVDVRKTDVELLESLSDAAIRSGHTQTAIAGYAWALRLRAALNAFPMPVSEEVREEAERRGE